MIILVVSFFIPQCALFSVTQLKLREIYVYFKGFLVLLHCLVGVCVEI